MKKILKLMLLVILLLSGCSNNKDSSTKDELKIISLAPSITESLIAMNQTKNIIAVDKFSKFSEINKSVKKIDAWNLPVEQLIELSPDVILFPDYSKDASIEKSLESTGINVVYISGASSINDIYAGINEIGVAINNKNASDELIKSMKNDISNLKKEYESNNLKSVYFEISPYPDLYTVGNNSYINEMIEIAGGKNIFASQDGFFKPSEEVIVSLNPDLIITTVNTKNSIDEIKNRSGFTSISAVSNNNIFQIDSNLTDRPGPSIIEGIKAIAKCINE